MEKQSKRRLFIVIALVLASIICAMSYTWLNSRSLEFESLDEFSSTWLNTKSEDRHKVLSWLVGETPERSTVYPLEQTKLHGLNRSDIELYLGVSRSHLDGVIYYDIGSIELDITGALIPGFSKRDVLEIRFDEHGDVIKVATTS